MTNHDNPTPSDFLSRAESIADQLGRGTPPRRAGRPRSRLRGWRVDSVNRWGTIKHFDERRQRPAATCQYTHDPKHLPPKLGCTCGWRLCTEIDDVLSLYRDTREIVEREGKIAVQTAERSIAIIGVEGTHAVPGPTPWSDPPTTWAARTLGLVGPIWLPPSATRANSTGVSIAAAVEQAYRLPVRIHNSDDLSTVGCNREKGSDT